MCLIRFAYDEYAEISDVHHARENMRLTQSILGAFLNRDSCDVPRNWFRQIDPGHRFTEPDLYPCIRLEHEQHLLRTTTDHGQVFRLRRIREFEDSVLPASDQGLLDKLMQAGRSIPTWMNIFLASRDKVRLTISSPASMSGLISF